MNRAFKTIAAALALSLFTTNVLLAHSPESNFWAQRKKQNGQLAALPSSFSATPTDVLNRLPTIARPTNSIAQQIKNQIPKNNEALFTPLINALPQNIGSVRRVIAPKTAKVTRTVIQIQDVHMNAEAQQNIGQAVKELIDQKSVGLIALEGAFGPEDFSVYHNFPYQDSVKAVADYLLRENKISGAVHTAFLSKKNLPPVVGVDHKEHYDANVEAYKVSAPQIKKIKETLAKQEQTLIQEKAATFNPDLKNFDAFISAYHKGTLSWGDYVRMLIKHSDNTTHEIDVFVEALNLEASINFARVESERAQLLNKLVSTLTETETNNLLNHSAAYRLGTLSHTDFYEHLKNLCAKKGITLSHYKAMDDYIRYVLLSDAINVENVMKDVAMMEEAIYSQLAKTEEEKNLIAQSRALALTNKLVAFSLTREEWTKYKAAKPSSPNAFVGDPINQNGFPIENFGNDDLSSFEKFYTEALARDTAMTENLLKAMDDNKASVAVLVTGGFHTEGMAKQLLDKGVATITYAPKITKIEDESGTGYLSVFTQEKTPLDKLFAGEKLFIPPHVTTPSEATIPVAQAHHQAIANGKDRATYSYQEIAYTVLINRATGAILSASVHAASRIGELIDTVKGWIEKGKKAAEEIIEALFDPKPEPEPAPVKIINERIVRSNFARNVSSSLPLLLLTSCSNGAQSMPGGVGLAIAGLVSLAIAYLFYTHSEKGLLNRLERRLKAYKNSPNRFTKIRAVLAWQQASEKENNYQNTPLKSRYDMLVSEANQLQVTEYPYGFWGLIGMLMWHLVDLTLLFFYILFSVIAGGIRAFGNRLLRSASKKHFAFLLPLLLASCSNGAQSLTDISPITFVFIAVGILILLPIVAVRLRGHTVNGLLNRYERALEKYKSVRHHPKEEIVLRVLVEVYVASLAAEIARLRMNQAQEDRYINIQKTRFETVGKDWNPTVLKVKVEGHILFLWKVLILAIEDYLFRFLSLISRPFQSKKLLAFFFAALTWFGDNNLPAQSPATTPQGPPAATAPVETNTQGKELGTVFIGDTSYNLLDRASFATFLLALERNPNAVAFNQLLAIFQRSGSENNPIVKNLPKNYIQQLAIKLVQVLRSNSASSETKTQALSILTAVVSHPDTPVNAKKYISTQAPQTDPSQLDVRNPSHIGQVINAINANAPEAEEYVQNILQILLHSDGLVPETMPDLVTRKANSLAVVEGWGQEFPTVLNALRQYSSRTTNPNLQSTITTLLSLKGVAERERTIQSLKQKPENVQIREKNSLVWIIVLALGGLALIAIFLFSIIFLRSKNREQNRPQGIHPADRERQIYFHLKMVSHATEVLGEPIQTPRTRFNGDLTLGALNFLNTKSGEIGNEIWLFEINNTTLGQPNIKIKTGDNIPGLDGKRWPPHFFDFGFSNESNLSVEVELDGERRVLTFSVSSTQLILLSNNSKTNVLLLEADATKKLPALFALPNPIFGFSEILLAAAILLILAGSIYGYSRFKQWNKKQIAFNLLVDSLRKTMREQAADEKPLNIIISDMHARNGGDFSMNLANGFRVTSTAPNLDKAVALGLSEIVDLSAAHPSLGQRFSNATDPVTTQLKTTDKLAILVHLTDPDQDLARLKETILTTSAYNKDKPASQKRGVAMSLGANLDENARQTFMAIFDKYKSQLPLAFVDEKTDLNQNGNESIPYANVFSKLSEKFAQVNHDVAQLYSSLADEKNLSETKVLVIGTPVTAYTASERLMDIMTVLAPIQGGLLMIDLRTVLLAAKQA